MTTISQQSVPEFAPLSPVWQRWPVLGRNWLYFALILATMSVYRPLLWRFGVHVPQRFLSAAFAIPATLVLIYATKRILSQLPSIPAINGHMTRVSLLILWLFALGGLGFLKGNFPTYVGKEFLGLSIFACFLVLGRYDQTWEMLEKPLTILFWINFVMILLTYRIPGVLTDFTGSIERDILYRTRNLGTVGADLRKLMVPAFLLGSWGLIKPYTDKWRVMQIGAIFGFLIVNVLIFRYRSALISMMALLFIFAFVLPIYTKRVNMKMMMTLAFFGLVGLAIVAQTEAFTKLVSRFRDGEIFGTRVDEARAFFSHMGIVDLITGRGFGGWYTPPIWTEGTRVGNTLQWYSNHFGFLGFVLRGGVLFMVMMFSFIVPMFKRKPVGWSWNIYNLIAILVGPVIVLNILLNPIAMNVDNFSMMMVWGLVFARFATPAMPPPPHWQSLPIQADSSQ